MLMFFLKDMTLGNITNNNSVKDISQSEQNQEIDSKPKTIDKNLLTRKQDKGIS